MIAERLAKLAQVSEKMILMVVSLDLDDDDVDVAFVPPADIQAFTSETKTKLSTKCQIKTKYFVQAVKEICVEYDELNEEKSRGLRDETDGSKPGYEASSGDGVEVDGAEANLKNGTAAVAPVEDASSCRVDVVVLEASMKSPMNRVLKRVKFWPYIPHNMWPYIPHL
ncbi:hypothetical protein F3Y22_tig00110597pilonHSYRG00487 [Hibiscus syriacus]|uniref:Uncharacterized protein n=1 Tax=Hibiscus syriacus TaxID=106335 RepID=A0A6A3A3J1_HIBSY|nr:hypothetical protein F3Y22_tig00110597pilonHSYRG00487 [Hibiscus syriacus]